MLPVDPIKAPACSRFLPTGFTIADDHIIQLKNDRGTSYEKYLQVQNELTAAYREVRDQFCEDYLEVTSYAELTDPTLRSEIEPSDLYQIPVYRSYS